MTNPPTMTATERRALAIRAIEGWQRNRMTTFTPSNILSDFGDEILNALRLSTPADQAVREAAIEECAKIVDDECERILSKQVLTTAGDMVTQMAVNANLRMMACFLPELSAAIRSLTTEPKRS